MSWLGPNDWLAIAAGNHEQSFPTGRRPEVASLDHAPFDGIAQALQLVDKHGPRLTSALGVGHKKLSTNGYNFSRVGYPVNHSFRLGRMRNQIRSHNTSSRLAALRHQRPPLQDLLHVLEADHPGLLLAGPL